MEYFSSRLTSSSRGSVKVDIEEAVVTDEQVEESEEAGLRQTVDVPVEAVEQVLTYLFWVLVFLFPIKSYEQAQLKKRGHRRGTSDTSTIDFRWKHSHIFTLGNSHILEIFKNLKLSTVGEERMRRTAETSPEVGPRCGSSMWTSLWWWWWWWWWLWLWSTINSYIAAITPAKVWAVLHKAPNSIFRMMVMWWWFGLL